MGSRRSGWQKDTHGRVIANRLYGTSKEDDVILQSNNHYHASRHLMITGIQGTDASVPLDGQSLARHTRSSMTIAEN
jgi:hypothetical protein